MRPRTSLCIVAGLDFIPTSIGLTFVIEKAPKNVGSVTEDTDAPEANEVPVFALSVRSKEIGVDFVKSNLNGGVTVSGYFPGGSGVWSTAITTYESERIGGCHGS